MRQSLVLCGMLLLCCCQREGGHMRAAVPELSGLVKSQRHEGVFWAHSDSGNAAELWAIDATGRTLGRYTVDAHNRDWEDIAADAEGNLYLGDIGDNFGMRDDLTVLRIREPNQIAAHGVLQVSARQPFRYPDSAKGKRRHSDAEALFFTAGRLYLLTKERFSTLSVLYRFPAQFTDKPAILERVASVELRAKKKQGAAPVTASDVSRDGTRVAITAYKHLYVFRFDGDHLLAARETGDLVPFVLAPVARPAY